MHFAEVEVRLLQQVVFTPRITQLALPLGKLPRRKLHLFGQGDFSILFGPQWQRVEIDDVEVILGGRTIVRPFYAGRSPQFPGIDQVNFTLPAGLEGCYVSVAI